MMAFNWNVRKVKAIMFSPGGNEIVEATPAWIVRHSNRQQVETLIQSLCVCVTELMEIQEKQAERIAHLQSDLLMKNGETNKVHHDNTVPPEI